MRLLITDSWPFAASARSRPRPPHHARQREGNEKDRQAPRLSGDTGRTQARSACALRRLFHLPAIGSPGREPRSRFGSHAAALVAKAGPGDAGSTLRLKFGEFLIFLRRHCDEIRNSGNRTGVQPMGMQFGRVEAAGSLGCQPHGGRTSAMPTAWAGSDRRPWIAQPTGRLLTS